MADRIVMLSEEEAVAAARAIGIRESMAPLSVYRVLLRHPELTKSITELLTTLLFTSKKLDARLRELIIMRIAWVTGSNYEWTQHWRIAGHVGLPAEDVLAVRDWENAESLAPADRAVLAAVDETLKDGKVSDATWADCAANIGGPVELIEMVVAIGNWTMFSQLLRSLEIPLEDGVAAWPPDGEASGNDAY
ncbi:MAG: carboxymuconolactone decarboxylase family protein [Alphaproteobacteria bacterium]|nr:carboxymuconolactone decarboxylase family protein [Alphaproteobacteria bacterium]